jgi:glycosyltransferase involved in cell wall biosynthesis
MARHSSSDLRFLFLEPNFSELGFPSDADVIGPDARIGVLGQLRLLRRHLRSGQYAAVVSNTLRAAVFIAILNRSVPHFMYLRDGADRLSLSWAKSMMLQHLVMPRVSRVFPNSSWTAKSLGSRHANKVTTPVFSPSGSRETEPVARGQEDQANPSPLRLLSLSRIVEWKGIHIVMEALSLLSDKADGHRLSLTVAGGTLMGPDSYLKDLIAKAENLPFDVDFIGHQNDVSGLLDRHDVLVHASIRPEPFGQVIVQGLSAQLAVIASDAGGPAEIIQHGESGLLHRAGDAKELAAQIKMFLDSPTRKRAMQLEGSRRAGAFSDPTVIALFDVALSSSLAELSTDRSHYNSRSSS